MCRNIQTLFNLDPPATREEIRAAALQYVRKVSGFDSPSILNRPVFLGAVDAITAITVNLIQSLETDAPPRSRKKGRRAPRTK